MAIPAVTITIPNQASKTNTVEKSKDGNTNDQKTNSTHHSFETENGSNAWSCSQQLKMFGAPTNKKGPPSDNKSSEKENRSSNKTSSITLNEKPYLRERIKAQAFKFYISEYGFDKDIISNTQLHKSVESKIGEWVKQGDNLSIVKSKITTFVQDHKERVTNK